MKLEMICTGEEVLSGQIIDTNAAWFADLMNSHGLELQRKTTVGDRMQDLIAVFRERSQHADVILVNGGLGPTSDDLSAEAIAQALNEPLLMHEGWREHLQDWFRTRQRVMPESNLKQCLLPASAVLVDNPVGSAPGFRVRLNQAWLFFTPGVPSEFKPMVSEQFLPFLRENFGLADAFRLHKLLTLGHGESTLADSLQQLTLPAGISFGYRPSAPHVEIKVFARGAGAVAALPTMLSEIRKLLGTAVVSEQYPSIAQEVHHLLLVSGHSLALAESCTGGMLSMQLTDFAGSSAYLQQSLVTYANTAKQKVLGIPQQVLDEHGAVSLQTARLMADNVRLSAASNFGLAITGIAGPDGGSPGKPVGTVCLALSTAAGTWAQQIQLSQRSRHLVRVMSCAVALDMLRRQLQNTACVVDYPSISRTAVAFHPAH